MLFPNHWKKKVEEKRKGEKVEEKRKGEKVAVYLRHDLSLFHPHSISLKMIFSPHFFLGGEQHKCSALHHFPSLYLSSASHHVVLSCNSLQNSPFNPSWLTQPVRWYDPLPYIQLHPLLLLPLFSYKYNWCINVYESLLKGWKIVLLRERGREREGKKQKEGMKENHTSSGKGNKSNLNHWS